IVSVLLDKHITVPSGNVTFISFFLTIAFSILYLSLFRAIFNIPAEATLVASLILLSSCSLFSLQKLQIILYIQAL
ncbi:hypothetical protein, partial [Leyella stercorea]